MGGDSNPRCLAAHTLSRRAQSTTLSPIQNDLPFPLNLNLSGSGDNRNRAKLRGSGRGRLSYLQAPEQFVERQLNADVKLAEVSVLGADRIEPHFVNDGFDLKRVAREKGHAPFRVVETGRAGNQLFNLASKLASDSGVSFHQFAAFVIRQGVPVALFAAALAHVIKTNYRPIRQRRINAILPVMLHSVAKRFQRFFEFRSILPDT